MVNARYGDGQAVELRTGMATASLVLGVVGLFTLGCLGIGSLAGLVLGIVAMVRASREPSAYGAKGRALAGVITNGLALLLIPVVGIMAAIAIPSLLRAKTAASEAATIGDIRTVISAQAAYQSANAGSYDGRLECLNAPASCIPNYPAAGPSFLPPELVREGVKTGYLRSFEPGPAPTDLDATRASPSSVTSYAYVAVPAEPGRTGVRGFCGDASGVICYTTDGERPRTNEGACDVSSCTILQ